MSSENFRRELNAAFDQISGSPSPALRDRVRSSLAQAPEAHGPYWIAAAAAAVIAIVIIAVLFAGNPLNRHQTPVGPTVRHSPTPSVPVTPAATPSPIVSPQTFVCTSSTMAGSNAPLTAYIDALRTGAHPGYDRLTIEFQNGQPASVQLQPQAGTSFTTSPAGQAVTLKGTNGVLVTIHGSDLHTDYSGSIDIVTGDGTLVEVRRVQDFEGVVQLALGIQGPACYHAFFLSNPSRLVIDIQAS